MTVLLYVNTSKQVGDPDHLKVFANADALGMPAPTPIPQAGVASGMKEAAPLFFQQQAHRASHSLDRSGMPSEFGCNF